jgi:hypothetical protein
MGVSKMSKKKKFDSIIKWIFGIGTVGMAAKAGAKIKQYQVEHNPTEEAENTVGYNDISVRYNNKNVLVVAHSAVLRVIHYLLGKIPDDGDLTRINIPNLRIIEYEIK